MTFILLILFAWCVLKAFSNAIIFAKGGEDCFTVWHIADWSCFWLPSLYAIYKLGYYKMYYLFTVSSHDTMFIPDFKFSFRIYWMAILIIGTFGFNLMYRLFRLFNVYKIDNSLRWKLFERIIGRGGLI